MTDQIWWYATRAAGLMTWATAMSSLVLGLVLSFSSSNRSWARRLPSKPWLLDLHRFMGGLSVVFLAVHMVTLWADSFVHFAWAELFIPGASEWRPLAVAWGVVAAWLIAAVEASSLLRDRIPARLWHGIHLSSYLVAVLGTVHAVQAGSDVGHPVVYGFGLLMILAVVGLTVVRVATLRRGDGRDRRAQLERARRLRDGRRVRVLPSLAERLREAKAHRQEQSRSENRYPPPAHRDPDRVPEEVTAG